jgi:hypothetical protein
VTLQNEALSGLLFSTSVSSRAQDLIATSSAVSVACRLLASTPDSLARGGADATRLRALRLLAELSHFSDLRKSEIHKVSLGALARA